MKKQRVSIILTTYNHERFIEEALVSLINQTCQDFNLIIVNDASTDSTQNIIDQVLSDFDRDRLCLITHKENIRPKLSANVGLRHVNSDFVAWLDGDDVWAIDKLEKQLHVFDTSTDDNLGVVYSFGKNFNEETSRDRSVLVSNDVDDNPIRHLFEGRLVLKISLLVRRGVYDHVGGYFERFLYCCDYNNMLRVALAGYSFKSCPEVLVYHRIHKYNDTRNRLKVQLNILDMISEIIRDNSQELLAAGCNTDGRIQDIYWQIVKHGFIRGDNRIARKYLLFLFNSNKGYKLVYTRGLLYLFLSYLPETFFKILIKSPVLKEMYISD